MVVQLDGLPPERLNHELVSRGVSVRELVVERPTLEQVFLSLTGDSAEGGPGLPAVPAPRGAHGAADPRARSAAHAAAPPLPAPPGSAQVGTEVADAAG
jgi:hypothetical protein